MTKLIAETGQALAKLIATNSVFASHLRFHPVLAAEEAVKIVFEQLGIRELRSEVFVHDRAAGTLHHQPLLTRALAEEIVQKFEPEVVVLPRSDEEYARAVRRVRATALVVTRIPSLRQPEKG